MKIGTTCMLYMYTRLISLLCAYNNTHNKGSPTSISTNRAEIRQYQYH